VLQVTAHKPGDPTTLNRLYGRSSGHKLRKGQADLVETLLPQISVPTEGELTAARLFGEDRPLHLEIGFGSGEHLAYRADLLPDHGFIGCEPFVNGVATALGHIRDQHLANVRIHMGERGGDPIHERLAADEAMVGEQVGAVGEMLAAAEADLEMERAILAEQRARRDVALGRHFDLRQEGVDQILLALAQLVPARPPVEAVEGERVAGFERSHRRRRLGRT